MTSITASPNTLEPSPFTPSMVAGREVRVSDSLRLAAVTESRRAITLNTKEGDTVTLSLERSTVAVYGLDTLAGIEVDIRQSRTILAARTTGISALIYAADGQTETGSRPGGRLPVDLLRRKLEPINFSNAYGPFRPNPSNQDPSAP